MLACAMTEAVTGAAFDRRYREWRLEEKLDGHRVLAVVEPKSVTAWSRPRGSAAPNPRTLSPAIVDQLRRLSPGVYDGELVAPGGHAWDVVRTDARTVLVLFDVLEVGGQSLLTTTYLARRLCLLRELRRLSVRQEVVTTVESVPATWHAVLGIWARGGEGAVLKRPESMYQPGVRSPAWVKVKQLHHATLTVTGFDAGKSGPCSAFILRDDTGVCTTVKVLGHAMLRDVTARPAHYIGRRVVITYQQRTPSGTYRHGMFDHFASEDE